MLIPPEVGAPLGTPDDPLGPSGDHIVEDFYLARPIGRMIAVIFNEFVIRSY
jgi:hypothetical protein